jgi:hypothetical protein
MLRARVLIFGFVVLGISCLGGLPCSAWAEDVAIRYQVLDRSDALDSSTWTVKLELSNQTGEELHHLSINLFVSIAQAGSGQPAVNAETLEPAVPQVLVATFDLSHNDLAVIGDAPLRFILQYETAGGIPRSAVIQGQAGPSGGE